MSNQLIIKQTHYANMNGPSTSHGANGSLQKAVHNTSIIQLKLTHNDSQSDGESVLPVRVYLYLQPQEIAYVDPPDENTKYEIELSHSSQVITRLTETESTNNIIDVDAFHETKPTFNLVIFQDSIDHITAFDDVPLLLTLYETTSISNTTITNVADSTGSIKLTQRIPKAQGFIDLLQFFLMNRSTNTIQLHLHPIIMDEENLHTCRMTWHIYSLMPLLKTVHFSNCIFIAFTSIYNAHEPIMSNAEQLIANLSFQKRNPPALQSPSEAQQLSEKMFICSYHGFEKSIISDQYLYYKWETLKNPEINNNKGLGISSNINVNLHRLFAKLMYPERCQINISNIKHHEDYALICNSLHRFVLTHAMHKRLHEFLADNTYIILLDIINANEPDNILLQGTLDPSIFMYPGVYSCNFAIELKPLQRTSPNEITKTPSTVRNTKKAKMDTTQQESLSLDTFAIIKICLNVPITEPPVDLNASYNKALCQSRKHDLKYDIECKCQECYVSFEEVVLGLADYIQEHQIQKVEGNEKYLCDQVQNISNSILPLISCDFNRRFITKNTIQFANLMTTVYQELCGRIHVLLADDNTWKINRITCVEIQENIIKCLNTIKFLDECGKIKESERLAFKLEEKYCRNSMYAFYIFLDRIQKRDYDYARSYLLKPIAEQEIEAQLFLRLIKIYLDYLEELHDSDELIVANATGNVINNLVKYCEETRENCQIGWLILHSAYKICGYRPGMEYARWQFDNLVGESFIDITYKPLSRWEILNPFDPKLYNERDQLIWKIIKLLLTLGLYHFAEWIFHEILADYLTETECYILRTSFMLHLNQLPKNFNIITFQHAASPETKAMLKQVNGNVRYHFDRESSEALNDYKSIIHIQNLNNANACQNGLLRSAFGMLDNRKYQEALNIFEFAVYHIEERTLIHIGLGITLYYLKELHRAKTCLVACTYDAVCIPSVWGYLALINLKLNNNYEALECWKYYRMNTNDFIDEEILRELEKINYNDINLYVDDI